MLVKSGVLGGSPYLEVEEADSCAANMLGDRKTFESMVGFDLRDPTGDRKTCGTFESMVRFDLRDPTGDRRWCLIKDEPMDDDVPSESVS
tara:strand:- start:35 stop:304 length:270 start_codon:yes stop_codon:yes gene_type:complete